MKLSLVNPLQAFQAMGIFEDCLGRSGQCGIFLYHIHFVVLGDFQLRY